MIAIKFSVRGRDLGGAVADARARTRHLFQAPYRAIWSGEFEEMEDAENRLLWIVPLALGVLKLPRPDGAGDADISRPDRGALVILPPPRLPD